MSTLVLTLFTFWPPAPPLLAKVMVTSPATVLTLELCTAVLKNLRGPVGAFLTARDFSGLNGQEAKKRAFCKGK